MKRNVEKFAWIPCACLLLAFCVNATSAQSPNSAPAQSPSATSDKPAAPAKPATNAPSDADIAAAKSQGKVWVNLDTKIYHKAGRWYGKTKSGKFMTEADAKAAGYKASHSN